MAEILDRTALDEMDKVAQKNYAEIEQGVKDWAEKVPAEIERISDKTFEQMRNVQRDYSEGGVVSGDVQFETVMNNSRDNQIKDIDKDYSALINQNNALIEKVDAQETRIKELTAAVEKLNEKLDKHPIIDLWNNTKQGFSNTLNAIGNTIQQAWNDTKSVVNQFYNDAITLGKNAISEVKTDMSALGQTLKENNAVYGYAADLKMNPNVSMDRSDAQYYNGQAFTLDNTDGARDNMRTVRDLTIDEAIAKREANIANRANDTGLFKRITNFFADMSDKNEINALKAQNVVDKVSDKVIDGTEKVISAAQAAVNGMRNGLANAQNALVNIKNEAALAIANVAVKTLQPTLDKANNLIEANDKGLNQVSGHGFNHFDKDESDFDRADDAGEPSLGE